MTYIPIEAYERPALFLANILSDERSINSLVEKLDKIRKALADLILVAVFYEAATRAGVYTKGIIQNITLVVAVLVGYIITPTDIVPDVIPIVGATDDLLLAAALVGMFYTSFLRNFARHAKESDLLSKISDRILHPSIKARIQDACSSVAELDINSISKAIIGEIRPRLLTQSRHDKGEEK